MFLKLKAQDLQQLNVSKYGHRLILAQVIEDLNSNADKQREILKEKKIKKQKMDVKKYFTPILETDKSKQELESTNTN